MTGAELDKARAEWFNALAVVEEAKELAVDAGIAYAAARANADPTALAAHDQPTKPVTA